ncbi:hypothetical protein CDCA_CDCA09G2567 [Cyanidium caldarium]|uniref:P-type domain-containing protein n=1 Tax=Cyanidium caldarium TaxID=2771 RepID=A0AAV9IWA4_CYACA|nr:hypothetical protein CDCA_CDCA09G2567 [Cyanidium caldarium]
MAGTPCTEACETPRRRFHAWLLAFLVAACAIALTIGSAQAWRGAEAAVAGRVPEDDAAVQRLSAARTRFDGAPAAVRAAGGVAAAPNNYATPKKTPTVKPAEEVQATKKQTKKVIESPKKVVKKSVKVVTITARSTVTVLKTPTPTARVVTVTRTVQQTRTPTATVQAVSRTPSIKTKAPYCRFWIKNCNIEAENRQICFTGENIDEYTCIQIGCCWQSNNNNNNNNNGAPPCYRAIWAPVCNLRCDFSNFLTGTEGVSATPAAQQDAAAATSANDPSANASSGGSSSNSGATAASATSSGNPFAGLNNLLSGLNS